MRRILLLITFLGTLAASLYAQQVIAPSIHSRSTFAIITDSESYRNAAQELQQYRQAVEREGLGTYLIVDSWTSPEAIRTLLEKLYRDHSAPLEGCVLVGDIPIPMIRDAQHLTSAFKMNQARDWKRSSVPSDRYYDDFDLKFDFIKRDSVMPLYFYYSLNPSSSRTIGCDIYSARIKPLEIDGVDKYRLLREFLTKVVREKQAGPNPLDRMSDGRGHGYLSEDPAPWANEHVALREQLPQLHLPGASMKHFEFDTYFPMREHYLNEVQRVDLDIFLLHHHGGPETEYINGEPAAADPSSHIESVKRYLRSKVPAQLERVGKDSTIIYYHQRMGIPKEWTVEAMDAERYAHEDSLFSASMDIHTTDIRQTKPGAKYIVLDACFNGSFHLPDYIAGAYLFSDGHTVAVNGNTVNTLQEVWKTEFFGLLGAGLRLGNLQKMTGYLENHLMGDPTYHFANNSTYKGNVNDLFIPRAVSSKQWKSLLSASLPDLQALALRRIYDSGESDMAQLLEKIYFDSPYYVVRLEALKLLAEHYPEQSHRVLDAAVTDAYDMVRRFATQYMVRIGDPALLPAFVRGYLERNHEPRTGFKAVSGIGTFDAENLRAEVSRQTEGLSLYSDAFVKKIMAAIDGAEKSLKSDLKTLSDSGEKTSRVRSAVLAHRNFPDVKVIPALLRLLSDPSTDMSIRIAAAETLGWYDLSYRRGDILEGLKSVKSDDPELSRTIAKSIGRLQHRVDH